MIDESRIRLGISSCLLGNRVRYDGGHKRDRFLDRVLRSFVEWVPVCPEVEAGMGIPRPIVRLVHRGGDVRMIAEPTGTDHTEAMRRYTNKKLHALASLDLCGYVLKKDSPSCGMERVRLHGEKGQAERRGRGLFAAALLERFPHLPVEEEGRLGDAALRESFIERIFAYRRLRDFFRGRWTVGGLVAFHTSHELQLMAHAPKAYAELAGLVDGTSHMNRTALRDRYMGEFMTALEAKCTPRRHVSVLQYMAGCFREDLDPTVRQEIATLIEDYRHGLVPLVVPLTLIRHYVRRLGIACLQGQRYLEPHPKELMLRNHV